MKITVEGFSQFELVKRGLDLQDALILRWFVDFKDTDKMVSEIVGNDKFYWVNYEGLLEDLPILNMKKDALGRRLFKLKEIGILKHFTKRKGGTFSMYAIGEEFKHLIDIDLEHYGRKVGGGTDKKYDPYGLKVGTKDSSIKNSSIKKTQKQTTAFGLTKKEKQILFVATTENVILTKYFIKELADKFTFEKCQELITECGNAKKSIEIEQDGAYIRGIIKRQGLVKPKKKPAAPVQKIEEKVTEELKVKQTKDDFIKTYLNGRKFEELPLFDRNNLNKTLERMGYEQIK